MPTATKGAFLEGSTPVQDKLLRVTKLHCLETIKENKYSFIGLRGSSQKIHFNLRKQEARRILFLYLL